MTAAEPARPVQSQPETGRIPAIPPSAERRPFVRNHHGDEISDPYEWLRDPDDPEVIAYLEAENAYTEARTAGLSGLREEIFDEIRVRTRETDLSVPSYADHRGGQAYWYYQRTLQGSEYPIFCRAPAGDPLAVPDLEGDIADEQVLLDCNTEAAGSDFYSVGGFAVSPGGELLAHAVDLTGNERFQLRITDLRSGERLPETIDDLGYGLAWAGEEQLFYTRADQAWRPHQVLRHRLGADPASDPVIFDEPDERFWVSVDASRDEQWVIITAGSKLTTEVRLLPTAEPEAEPRVVAPRRQGVEYEVEPAGDRLLILHNDGAEDFCLAEAPVQASGPEQWRTVIGHRSGVRLLEVDGYADQVVVGLRRNGLTGVHVIPRDQNGDLGAGTDIDFDEPLYTVSPISGRTYRTPTIRLYYSSLTTPESIYDYRVADGELITRKVTPVLDHPTRGRYRPEDYVQQREWATAADGTEIPLSVVYHRDTPIDGTAPAVIYGYGSYEIPMDPAFQIPRLSLLDRGFVYAIAHVRGGGELGRSWYEQGRTTTKINTFTDFVSCAQHLIATGYTSADRLAARGGSAGGLLMGAAANLAPDTFRAVHAAVPFVDPLTSILMPELPLTVIEWEEWGDPLHEQEVYAYMKSYSPYENLSARPYPAILATTSLHDTRVLFTEPAKWVAALRHVLGQTGDAAQSLQPDDRPILLKTEMTAGHGGVSGRYQSWRETAFEYAWIIDQVAGRTR